MNSYDNCMNAGSTNRKRVNPLGKPRGAVTANLLLFRC